MLKKILIVATKSDPRLALYPERRRQDEAAQNTEDLDALEAQCMELSAELKDKETKLKQIQEVERKCSREYIAYEKAKAKSAAAKAVKKVERPFGS